MLPFKLVIVSLTNALLQRLGCGHGKFFTFAVAGSRHYQNRSGRADTQLDFLGHFCEMNTHRHTLGQSNPLKGRADIRQQVSAGAAIVLGNPPAYTVDGTLQRLIGIAHESDDRTVTLANIFDVAFSEKPDNPVAVDIHQRHNRLVLDRLAAQPQIQVSDVTVDGGLLLGEIEIQLR